MNVIFKWGLIFLILFIFASLWFWRYTKVNDKFQDYELNEEKIKQGEKYDISVGEITFNHVDLKVNGNEVIVTVDIEILKNRDYKDIFYNNMDANLYLQKEEFLIINAESFKMKNGKNESPSRPYFDKHQSYKGSAIFKYEIENDNEMSDLEIAYLDRNGHKLKKLYFPFKVDDGKIV